MAFGSRWQIHYCFVHSSKQSKCCCGEWAVTDPAPRQHHAININKRQGVRSPRGQRSGVTWIRSVTNKFGESRALFSLHSCTKQTFLQGQKAVSGGQLPVIRRVINGQKTHKYSRLQSRHHWPWELTLIVFKYPFSAHVKDDCEELESQDTIKSQNWIEEVCCYTHMCDLQHQHLLSPWGINMAGRASNTICPSWHVSDDVRPTGSWLDLSFSSRILGNKAPDCNLLQAGGSGEEVFMEIN